MKKPFLLLILDGWGSSEQKEGNAILHAHTPHWDQLLAHCPHTLITGCGEAVGLPEGQMGNSEVGHLTLGAGRVIYQDLSRITHAIETGDFFQNPVLKKAFRKTKHAIHILGLLSPGGVHSHEDHIEAALLLARQQHEGPIYVHAFLDGRDTPPQSAAPSLEKLQTTLERTGASLASVCGRYYAMDRDQRWDRIQMAYEAIIKAQAPFYAASGLAALQQAYAREETDEFVKPTLIGPPFFKGVESGDTVIYMNFRSDRARALTQAMTDPDFTGFERVLPQIHFVTLTQYHAHWPLEVAFAPQVHHNVLSATLASLGKTQLHLAETEKYAHVTFFFNGGQEDPLEGEERILVPSPSVRTYDQCPQMAAPELTTLLVKNILSRKFDFIVCNFANADMVGHTGNFAATVTAIEALDQALAQIIPALEEVEGEALITADHGNAECMIDFQSHQAHTAHTLSLVPLVYVGKQAVQFKSEGTLSDVAPTLLYLMGLRPPIDMTGRILIHIAPDSAV